MQNTSENDGILDSFVHATQQYLAVSGHAQPLSDEEIVSRSQEVLNSLHLDQSQRANLEVRIKAYELLAKKDIRREASVGQTEAAVALLDTSGQVEQLIERVVFPSIHTIERETRSELDSLGFTEPSAALKSLSDKAPEDVYQELIGGSFEDAAKAVGKTNAKKWMDLVQPTFAEGKAIDLMDALGYIPHQIYDAKKKFSQVVHFPDLVSLHGKLRQREQGQFATDRGRTLQARAQLLKYLFVNETATEAKGKVTLDVNGIFINLEKRGKKKSPTKRLVSHLPFEYMTDELCDALVAQGWLTEPEIQQAKYRRAVASGDVQAAQELDVQAVHRLAGACNLDPQADSFSRQVFIASPFRRDSLPLEDADGAPVYIPDSVLSDYMNTEKTDYNYLLRNVLETAESFQQRIAGEENRRLDYDSYNLAESAGRSYKHRTQILHHPHNYNVPRMVGFLLEHMEGRNDIDHGECQVFRGTIKGNGSEKNHSYIEAVLSDGSVNRVLIDPKKQLTPRQQVLFDALPELNQEEHRTFETLVLTYRYYKTVLVHLREMTGARGFDLPVENLERALTDIYKDLSSFMILEDPARYEQVRPMIEAYLADPSMPWPDHRCQKLCEEAVEEFGQKLFACPNPRDSLQPFLTKIKRETVVFDDDYLRQTAQRYADKSYAWDEELCTQLRDIGHSSFVVQAEDRRKVPYHMEAAAIRALQLQQDKPLISLIGGCRDYSTGGSEDVDKLCDSFARSAQKLKANVSVPGTQSGIGAKISRAALSVQQQTGELPVHEKASFFAITPGGETYYPGNDLVKDDSQEETDTYAMVPLNTLVTPVDAGWNRKGERKRSAPYFDHLKYAEDVYNRLSYQQPRITVVSNGGLFTVAEANSALENKSEILLVRDTGRFADLAILLEEERERLNEILEQEKAEYINRFLHAEAQRTENAWGQGKKIPEMPPAPNWDLAVEKLIREKAPEHSRERLLREFGTGEETNEDLIAEQKLYREMVRKYFVLSENCDVQIASADECGEKLEAMVAEKSAKAT